MVLSYMAMSHKDVKMTNKALYTDVLRICDSYNYAHSANDKPVDEDGRILNQKAYKAGMAQILLSLYDYVIDDTMPTAYVTLQKGGSAKIGVNSEFWAKCSDQEKWWLLLHENTHMVNMHFVRSKYIANLNHNTWNRAADCANNQYIGITDTDTIGGVTPILPKNLSEQIKRELLPWMSAEYYYNEIVLGEKDNPPSGGGEGDEPGKEGNAPQTLDEHITQHDIDKIDEELFTEKMRGAYSNNALISILPKQIDSGVNWKAILARLIQKAIRHDSKKTTNRPHRKLNNFLLPKTIRSKKAKIAIAVDTSGSMLTSLDKVCAEIVKIISMHGVETEFFGMDTELYSLGKIDRHNVAETVTKLTGGGGTVFVDALPLLGKVTKNTPTILITDCDVDWPVNKVRFPLVVIGPEGKTSPYPTISADALFGR